MVSEKEYSSVRPLTRIVFNSHGKFMAFLKQFDGQAAIKLRSTSSFEARILSRDTIRCIEWLSLQLSTFFTLGVH